jgi:uncharacterized protein (TIGR03437 family)
VNAATAAAGPVAPDSWATIYGSNLSATTRSWGEGDFTYGGMPFSLDGVSVVLQVAGAPRLAYVGYVSPTQVNFLLPSDIVAVPAQVQVRNPAGISAQVPMTIQANAPQLLTVDGKHAWGVHANGSSLAQAAPGETLVLYGTGLGATNPAQIPGQIPTQPANLVRLLTATIGGAAATVVSGGIVPGSAGVYQLNVQIPADAANGDQPLVVELANATSAPVLITVQK